MTTTAQILRKAAADVRLRGIRFINRETCAMIAILFVAQRGLGSFEALDILRWSIGCRSITRWNDSQVSRAVVASEMESAADLAELMEGRE